MRVTGDPHEHAFRDEFVAFLESHAPAEALGRGGEPDLVGGGIPEWSRRWQATLFDHGWLVPSYPPELGGRNATDRQTLAYFEEMASRGLPRSLHFPGFGIVTPSLLEFGSDAQRQLVPAALRGDTVWCIGMSEPDAGSDLASLRTRAVLDGDQFVVNGQKVWTSYAMWAEKCFCYVRTDPSKPKHRGLSVLIVDMNTPGIEVRPLRQATGGTDFAEVFFRDVVVPQNQLVGELNDGWRITTASLSHERRGLWVEWVAGLEHVFQRVLEVPTSKGPIVDALIRSRLAGAYESIGASRALGYKGFATFSGGGDVPEHSLLKLATSELRQRLCELWVEFDGPAAMLDHPPDGHGTGGSMTKLLGSFAGTIGGGTSEIQRNAIAEHILGLPRG